MSTATKLVYEVIYRDDRFLSAAGDHDHIYRTTSKRAMDKFVEENECIGQPHETYTPIHVFRRWQREGKI